MSNRFINFYQLFDNAIIKGIVLCFAAVLAVVMSNGVFSDYYHAFLNNQISIAFNKSVLSLSFKEWINDLLMSVFFLSVGLEIKYEIIEGNLKTAKSRVAPIVGAVFGVVFPILIYLAFNHQDEIATKGWAIPAATDIAFSLAILSMIAKNCPASLRIFLTALAIIDDVIAVLVIAIFYTAKIDYFSLSVILGISFLLFILNKLKTDISLFVYLLIGVFLWYFFHSSGIHSTISGVILAAFIPLKSSKNSCSPLKTLEKNLNPYVNYLILPLFIFANLGIQMGNISSNFFSAVALGILFGLFVGKIFGISLAVYLLEKVKVISFQKGSMLADYIFISAFCGIGLTMSLFISLISFSENPLYLEMSKTGIISGSLVSVLIALLIKFLKQVFKSR